MPKLYTNANSVYTEWQLLVHAGLFEFVAILKKTELLIFKTPSLCIRMFRHVLIYGNSVYTELLFS